MIELPPDLLDRVFPFHFAVDPDLVLSSVGPSLERISPEARPGRRLAADLVDPKRPLSWDALVDCTDLVCTLELHHLGLQLRGQLLTLGPPAQLLFLGSPRLLSPAELGRLDLKVEDFALHDPSLELLTLVQTQAVTLADLRSLNARIGQQRRNLELKNRLLATSEDRYALAVRGSSDVLFDWDVEKEAVYFSPRLAEILGASEEDVARGMPFFVERLHPDDTARFTRAMEEHLAGGPPLEVEVRLRSRRGDRWFLVRGEAARDADGTPVRIAGSLADVTRRVEAEAELRRSEVRYRSLVDEVKEVIFRTDTSGRWTFLNFAWIEVTGFTHEESVGKTALDFVHEDDREENTCLFRPLYQGAVDEVSGTFRYRTADGRFRWCDVWARTVRDENGGLAGTTGTLVDVTERKLAAEAILKAKDAAERNVRARSEFLANMSHEVRTPLNGIIGMTDLALETELTQEQREYLSVARESAGQLLELIEEILDFSRIEARKLKLEAAPFSPLSTLEAAVNPLAHRAHEKGVELILNVDPRLPLRLVGDNTRLRQVLINLTANAIKFTDQGEVEVTVRREPDPRPGVAALSFAVRDTGIGIPEEKRKLVFEAFTQADGSITRRFGGTGLGLTISSQLVSAMGGAIEVESEVGKGSTFRFRVELPVDAEAPSLRGAELEGRRAVVVEPHARSRASTAARLGQLGLQVIEASSLAEAGTSCLSADLVVADLAAVHEGADKGVLAGVPVLLLAGPGARGLRGLPGAARLTRPPRSSELQETVRALVAGGMARPAAGKREAAATARALRLLVAEDNAVNRKVVLRILEKAGHSAVAVDDGRKALAALSRERFDAVLMDLQMPEMDGLEATSALRARGDRTPVVALTAWVSAEDEQRAAEVGFDAFVSKPVDAARLLAELERVMPAVAPAI